MLLPNDAPERSLPTVLLAQPADIDIVCVEGGVIRDRCSQTFAIPHVSGSMPVAAGPTLDEGEINHRSQQHSRCQGIFGRESLGCWGENLVVIAVQFLGADDNHP